MNSINKCRIYKWFGYEIGIDFWFIRRIFKWKIEYLIIFEILISNEEVLDKSVIISMKVVLLYNEL